MRVAVMTLAAYLLAGLAGGAEEPYVVPGDVVVFDVWKCFEAEGIDTIYERADALYFLTSLQGIVNRDAPRLYLLASLALFDVETRQYQDPDYRRNPVTELDQYWFEYFEKAGYLEGREVVRIHTLRELVTRYRDRVEGLVLWSMSVPATSNVALMAAGCEGLLPVSKDLGDGRFFDRVRKQLPSLAVKLDLCDRFDGMAAVTVAGTSYPTTGSAKNDCYRYVIEKYLRPGIANPGKMWFNCDAAMWGAFRRHYAKAAYGYLGDRNELQQNGMYNADYWVAQRAVIYDLCPWGDHTPADDPGQPLGADRKSWDDILEVAYRLRKGEFGVVGGFVPWWLKYTTHTGEKHAPVPTEWEFVSLLTSYNMGNDGDAAFGIANASFFQHLPPIGRKAAAFREPPPIAYDPGATYVAILMLDYDGSAWFNQMIPSVYDDPARGAMPLNWCVNPVLNERVPHAYRYMYEHRTTNDFLGFSDDGAAYIQPMSLSRRNGRITESGVASYERFANALNARFGVRYNVFYIDDTFDPEWARMAARITPDGFGCNRPMAERLVDGTPVNFVNTFHVAQREPFRKHIKQVFETASESRQYGAGFEALRCILMTPSMVHEAANNARAEYPNANVRFVDVPNFYRLLKYKLTHPVETPYAKAAAVTATPVSRQGVAPVDVADGPVTVVTRESGTFWQVANQASLRYMYFAVDGGFARALGTNMVVEVDYLDSCTGRLSLQYNSTHSSKPFGGAYEPAPTVVSLHGTGQARKARFAVHDAELGGRQNGQSDFRLLNESDQPLRVRRVTVRKGGPAGKGSD